MRQAPWVSVFPPKWRRPVKQRYVRKVSPGRERLARTYNRRRRAFLARHPKCQCCPLLGIVRPNVSSQVHHRNGRVGKNYLDENTWVAVCAECHDHIHRHPAWAYQSGMMTKRLSKEQINESDHHADRR